MIRRAFAKEFWKFMKISAVIAEYNPFHLGHALHLARTRELGADKIIVIMSGSFTQRGEAAVFDKFTRTACALTCGADLVLELPAFFALSPAQRFAEGAIRILDSLGCTDSLSFGSEIADLPILLKTAELLSQEPEAYRTCLRSHLAAGNSFPAARQKAFSQLYGEEIAAPLRSPNCILALEYLQALSRISSQIRPEVILRQGGAYLDSEMQGALSSALAIRSDLRSGGQAWRRAVPPAALDFYCNPVPEDSVFPHLLYQLRRASAEVLGQVFGVQEGLEHKLWQAGQAAESYENLLERIKSKRYPMARIKRALCGLLLGITKQAEQALSQAPLYARVLGIKRESMDLLSLLSKTARIPLICSAKDFPTQNPLFALDIWATDCYSTLQTPPAPAGRDYTQGLLVL